MNSPLKKSKQSSLSQFFKRPQHSQQSLPNLSYTPPKQKSNTEYDANKFASKITNSPGSSKLYHPSLSYEQHSNLDINSNMKLKLYDIYVHNQGQNNKDNQQKQFKENLFKKMENNKPHSSQQRVFEHMNTQQLMTKKLDNQFSDFDYNLSIQPEQIKGPDTIKHQNRINQFKLEDEERLQSNFLITPQNSLIKSPQKLRENQIHSFTPQISKIQKQPPSSEIIERLSFRNQSPDKNRKDEQTINTNNLKPFSKNGLVTDSPQSGKYYNNFTQGQNNLSPNIPSPKRVINKNNSKNQTKKQQTPFILTQSPNSKKKSNQDSILSSDDQDSSQILSKIRQLQSQVSQLKTHKYQFAINKYRQQMKYQLQRRFQKQVNQITNRYEQKKNNFKRQTDIQITHVGKSFQQIDKYKKTYAVILNQLKQNKSKIQEEYGDKVQEVRKYKDKLIHQWKRQSNQQIKKILNNTHTKHSTNLITLKEKSQPFSKEKSNLKK